jgi:hypothetical protein
MAGKGQLDAFSNVAILTVPESAANTLTFVLMNTQISFNQKVAWVLSRIEYFIDSIAAANFNGDSDAVTFGLSVSNSWTSPVLSEATILDYNRLQRLDYGTAASEERMVLPILKDFSSLPSGGLIVPAAPLYGFVKGSGLVSATSLTARMFYTVMELVGDDFWQLVEARRVLIS